MHPSPYAGKPLTQARLKQIMIYDPETGSLRYRIDWYKAKAGDICGNLKNTGYWKVGLDRQHFYVHRLAWLYVHGVWPEEIDHINLNPADNRIANLREASRSQNNANRHSNGASGLKGVYAKGRVFAAHIKISGKKVHLGYFKTAVEAHSAYLNKAREIHGEFARGTIPPQEVAA